jgi:hypothetical protein
MQPKNKSKVMAYRLHDKQMTCVCANAEVMVLPQYNKPKKTKDAQILKEGESSTIGI